MLVGIGGLPVLLVAGVVLGEAVGVAKGGRPIMASLFVAVWAATATLAKAVAEGDVAGGRGGTPRPLSAGRAGSSGLANGLAGGVSILVSGSSSGLRRLNMDSPISVKCWS